MPKGIKLASVVLGGFLMLSLLHVWLNVGFENLRWSRTEASEKSFRVGFLPVT
jgi:hypothetical protein